jgi:hypothetical protein
MFESPSEVEFKIRFGGKPNDINVNTLIKSLASVSSVIDELTNEVGGGQKLQIKIKAPEKGSFIIQLGLLPTEITDLLTMANFDIAFKVLGTLVGILTLRKLLKGEKPKEISEDKENINIKTKSGNIFTIEKTIYNINNNNVIINESLADHFEALEADSSIESFEVEDSREKKLFEVPRNEFETMSVREITSIPEENARIIEQAATVHIFKLVWDESRKWEFIFRGNKISALIADKSFFQSIDKGENFSKGDSLEVDLQIKQVFDNSVNTFKNQDYLIKKVHKHIKRPPQGLLSFEN